VLSVVARFKFNGGVVLSMSGFRWILRGFDHQCSLLEHGLSVANEIPMAFKEEGYSITGAICPLSRIRLSSSYS
jgi:hypothetical protein